MVALRGSLSASSRAQEGISDHGGALELRIGGDIRAGFGLNVVGFKAEFGLNDEAEAKARLGLRAGLDLRAGFGLVSGVGTRDGG